MVVVPARNQPPLSPRSLARGVPEQSLVGVLHPVDLLLLSSPSPFLYIFHIIWHFDIRLPQNAKRLLPIQFSAALGSAHPAPIRAERSLEFLATIITVNFLLGEKHSLGERVRTSDLVFPKRALYQAKLHPEITQNT